MRILTTALLILLFVSSALAVPIVNPALPQSAIHFDIFAASDTVCCHSSHWDIIVPTLTYCGDWTIFPFGGKSMKADGINVKVKLANSNNGWSEAFFIPQDYFYVSAYLPTTPPLLMFNTAVDTIAVQAEFSTCAADSVISYQLIMQGW